MAKIRRIVTSEVEGRNLSDEYDDNSYVYSVDGRIDYHGNGKMVPVLEPGKIYGANRDSGDGYGYNTIKLIPHAPEGETVDDRYLIIDPTSPNHIHIRAGGAQDGSNAELILGGENTHVRVVDSNGSVNILGTEINISSNASPSSLNINTYSGATINSNRTSSYSDANKVVATLGDLPTGATGSFTSADNKLITVTNGIITDIASL